MDKAGNTVEERIITEENAAPAPEPAKLPMAWHKFQKNFLLWVIALFYLARAFLTATGNIYYEESMLVAVLNALPVLRVLDCVFAAHCAAMVVCLILSALYLNKNARLLKKTYIALASGEAAYMLIRWAIAGLPPVNLQGMALVAAHLLLFFINQSYYRKRNNLLNRKDAL